MPRWPVPTVGLCLALAVAACAAPPERWAHSAGTDHPLTGQIYRVADGAVLSEAELIADAAAADFVLIGGRPDNLDHHRLQARVVSALQRDPRRSRALAFGMIGVDRQLAIVEYLDRHPGDAAGLGAALDWTAGRWPEWALYEPVARAALANGGQIVAADLDPGQKRAVFERGPQALRSSFVRRTGLDRGLAASAVVDLLAELDDAPCGEAPPEVVAGMYQVQRAREAMMADRLAAASGRAGGILIAGTGHVRKNRGAPWYLARLEPDARIVSIGLLEVEDDVRDPPADLPYDYLWFTPRVDDRDPCAVPEGDLQSLRGSG
ncbi:MAG TPA: ChaN family lipoprotein [Geminicoccaceae bacterium]|nr:ChaN family lipoprotein [Geminicoccaceae bacterium]